MISIPGISHSAGRSVSFLVAKAHHPANPAGVIVPFIPINRACPEGEVLTYSTTNKEGYREYKSPKQVCAACPSLVKCTESKDHQKVATRLIWQKYVEEAGHLRHHEEVKSIYPFCRQAEEHD